MVTGKVGSISFVILHCFFVVKKASQHLSTIQNIRKKEKSHLPFLSGFKKPKKTIIIGKINKTIFKIKTINFILLFILPYHQR